MTAASWRLWASRWPAARAWLPPCLLLSPRPTSTSGKALRLPPKLEQSWMRHTTTECAHSSLLQDPSISSLLGLTDKDHGSRGCSEGRIILLPSALDRPSYLMSSLACIIPFTPPPPPRAPPPPPRARGRHGGSASAHIWLIAASPETHTAVVSSWQSQREVCLRRSDV